MSTRHAARRWWAAAAATLAMTLAVTLGAGGGQAPATAAGTAGAGTPISRADAALARAAAAIAAHQPGRAAQALLTLRRNINGAHRIAMAQIGKPPADPESDDPPGPPAVMAVLALEHRVDTKVVNLPVGKRSATVVNALRLAIAVDHARRSTMLHRIVALPAEGDGGDYADGMADTLPVYAAEVQQLTTAVYRVPHTAAAHRVLVPALLRVRATNALVNAAYGGGE